MCCMSYICVYHVSVVSRKHKTHSSKQAHEKLTNKHTNKHIAKQTNTVKQTGGRRRGRLGRRDRHLEPEQRGG